MYISVNQCITLTKSTIYVADTAGFLMVLSTAVISWIKFIGGGPVGGGWCGVGGKPKVGNTIHMRQTAALCVLGRAQKLPQSTW